MNDEVANRLGVLVSSHYKQHAPRSHGPHPKPWSKTKKKKRESRPEQRERLKRLENEPVPQLFQNNPDRLAVGFLPSGWTRTVEGFWRSARQRKKAVIRNNRMTRRRFTRLCNINLYEPRHPAFLNRDFRAFVKNLEARGLIGHWTIQINRKNVVHWHILFVDCYLKPQLLKRLVQKCLHEVESFPRHRVYTDIVRNQGQKLDYILQVKKRGYGEVNDKDADVGKVSWTTTYDIYKKDRLLFVAKTGLHKNGTIGCFWAKGYNERKIWGLICSEAATVEKNYENPRVKKYVRWANERFGIPIRWARWNVSLNPGHLLDEGNVTSGSPPAPKNHRKIRKSCSSSGLVGEVFRSGRHGSQKPRLVVPQPTVRFKDREIGCNGSPLKTPPTRLRERILEPFDGLLRDTKHRGSGARPFCGLADIGGMCDLFQNEELGNLRGKTFELGP